MIIKRLRAINFQSYPSASVKLLDGPACIVGRNMSGKSSLARMIDWGLTGSFGYPNLSKFTKDLVRPFGDSKDPTIVELTVSIEDKDYVVTRVMEKKETVYITTPEGVRLKDEDAEELILSIAKIPHTGTLQQRKELFSRTFWFGVGQQTSFYSAKPSERKEILESINPFTKLPQYEETTSNKLKDLSSSLDEDERTLLREETTLSVKQNDLSSVVGDLDKAKALLDEADVSASEFKALETAINELSSRVVTTANALKRKPVVERELALLSFRDISEELSAAKSKLETIKELHSKRTDALSLERSLKAEIENLHTKKTNAEKTLKDSETKLSLLEEAIAIAKSYDPPFKPINSEDIASHSLVEHQKTCPSAEALKEVLAASEKALNEALTQMKDNDADIASSKGVLSGKKKELELVKERVLKVIDTLEGKTDGETCDHCGGELSKETAEEHLTELTTKMDDLEAEEKELEQSIELLRKNKESISLLVARFTKEASTEGLRLDKMMGLSAEVLARADYTKDLCVKAVKDANTVLSSYETEIKGKPEALSAAEMTLKEINVNASEVNQIADEVKRLKEIQLKNIEAENKSRLLKSELESLSEFKEEHFERDSLELNRIKKELDLLRDKERQKETVRKLVAEMESVQKKMDDVSERVGLDRRRKKVLTVLKGLLSKNGDARTLALANDVSNVVMMTNTYLKELDLNRSLAIDLKLKKDDKDEGKPIIDLNIEVDGMSGKVTPSNSQLKVIGMAMDLAVAKVGGRSGFIIVDEPEEGMDEINRPKVARFLRKASEQTILVTNTAASGFEHIVTTDEVRAVELTKDDFSLPKTKSSKVKKKNGRITETSEVVVDDGEV